MKFAYQSYTKQGDPHSGTVEAADRHEAEEKLRKRELIITKIEEQSEGASSHIKRTKKSGKKVSVKSMSEFAREFSILVATGTPIVDSIASLEKQAADAPIGPVLTKLHKTLEMGESLADSMRAQEQVFGQVFCALVAAGETAGNLDEMLGRAARLLRQEAKIRSNLMGAMMYPILLTLVSIVVLSVMIGVVLPRFAGLFDSLDTELPASTRVLISLSTFIAAWWWALIPALGLAVAGGVLWIRSDSGRVYAERFMLALPVFGPIVRSIQTARLFRVLGLLLESKVPIIESISLTRRSMSIKAYQHLLNEAEESVTLGESMSATLMDGGLVVPSAVEAVRNAERTGRMGSAMVQIADFLDEENETTIKSVSSLIEPIIMIGLGIMVGLVAISMFLPLFDLTASAGTH